MARWISTVPRKNEKPKRRQASTPMSLRGRKAVAISCKLVLTHLGAGDSHVASLLGMTDSFCGAYLLTNPASAGEWRVKDAAPYNISYLVTHNS